MGSKHKRTEVLVVDDHVMFAESLAAALDDVDDIEVVGIVHDGAGAISAARRLKPTVVLLDHRLPDRSGPEVAKAMLEDDPTMRIVMLTATASASAASAAIQAGCIGFVTKDERIADVAEAVRDAARGRTHLAASMIARLVSHAPHTTGPNLELSYRELEILELIAKGLSGPAIAEHLVLSHHTVRNHTQSILRKLDVHSRIEAIAKARHLGLISSPG